MSDGGFFLRFMITEDFDEGLVKKLIFRRKGWKIKVGMHSSVSIANYFITLSHKNKPKGFTLMQLLKLSYISHGFRLATSGAPLSKESAEAWRFGPVFHSIYHEFKRETPGGLITKPASASQETFNEKEREVMDVVYDAYGEIEGWKLCELTHKRGTPWYKTWHEKGSRDVKGIPIDNSDIKQYFQSLLKTL